MQTWTEVKSWRKAQRATLLSARGRIPAAARRQLDAKIIVSVRGLLTGLDAAVIGLYWPFKGEIDVRGLVGNRVEGGGCAALPVVVGKGCALEFWKWHPEMKLRPGTWDIPVPERRVLVDPTVLLVPLVGFDRRGFRLGYGAGYYDRTLAAMRPRPVTIGVGYEACCLPTIYPQPHDVPMDAIVTDRGVRWYNRTSQPVNEGYVHA